MHKISLSIQRFIQFIENIHNGS